MIKERNFTEITEFILLGFSDFPQITALLFVMFLTLYITALTWNLSLVVLIRMDSYLHTPMYFFLGHLSFVDICYSSNVTPNMLHGFISDQKTISYAGCFTQCLLFIALVITEFYLLASMALDRYVAICKPLHYLSIMSKRVCGVLVGIAWAGGFLHSIIQIIFTLQLPFCGPNVIDHYMCDLFPLLKLACTDTHIYVLLIFANSGAICIIIFSLLLVSYGIILFSLRAHSSEGRRKALSTCGSHIIVVLLCFVPCLLEICDLPKVPGSFV